MNHAAYCLFGGRSSPSEASGSAKEVMPRRNVGVQIHRTPLRAETL